MDAVAGPDLRAVLAASPHGTEARYGAGCRCEGCREAHALRMRRYRARRRERAEGVGIPDEAAAPRPPGPWSPEPRPDRSLPPEEGQGVAPAPALAVAAAVLVLLGALRSFRVRGSPGRPDGGRGQRPPRRTGTAAPEVMLVCGHRVPRDPSWRGHRRWCPGCGGAVEVEREG